MKRPRGRRITLLLASVLPLLAEHEDVDVSSSNRVDEHSQSAHAATDRPLMEHDASSPLQREGAHLDGSSEMRQCRKHNNTTRCSCNEENDASSWHQEDEDYFRIGEVSIPHRPFWLDEAALGDCGCDSMQVLASKRRRVHDAADEPPANSVAESTPAEAARRQSPKDDELVEGIDTYTEDDLDLTDSSSKVIATAVAESVTATTPPSTSTPASPALPANTKTAFMDAVDYASKAAGALILESSRGLDGAANLLTKDKDKYAIADCQHLRQEHRNKDEHALTSSNSINSYFVVIGLSEDILVKRIVLANYERYSSPFREFSVMGSPTADGNWMYRLGEFEMQLQQGKQSFDLVKPVWARYLKVEFKSYYGDEHYCTLSQIMVHGSTVLQGFHEQWEEDTGTAAVKSTDEMSSAVETAEEKEVSDKASSAQTALKSEQDNLVGAQWGNSERVPKSSIQQPRSVHTTRDVPSLSGTAAASWLKPIFSESGLSDGSNPDSASSLLSSASICLSNCRFARATRLQAAVNENSGAAAVQQSESIHVGLERLVALSESDGQLTTHSYTEIALAQEAYRRMAAAGFVDSTFDDAMHQLLDMKRTMDLWRSDESFISVASHSPSDEADQFAPDDQELLEVSASNVDDSQHETNVVLSKLLERYPSAQCLQQLDLVSFKAKFHKPRAGAVGQDAGGPAMEPIFKRLKDEMKSMQAAIALQDQYAMESLACYQRIIMELLVDMEMTRFDQARRLDQLERECYLGTRWMVALRRLIQCIKPFAVAYAVYCFDVLFWEDYGPFVSFIRLTAGSCMLASVFYLVKCLCEKITAQKSRPVIFEKKSSDYISDDSSSNAG
ncbi:hypothetical protein MPSEU_000633000 [Mayamaea pseudoterrestris]|nr:hypothetical protein MPSEU_000633000 [Mayamaea pseudoterrestris]